MITTKFSFTGKTISNSLAVRYYSVWKDWYLIKLMEVFSINLTGFEGKAVFTVFGAAFELYIYKILFYVKLTMFYELYNVLFVKITTDTLV